MFRAASPQLSLLESRFLVSQRLDSTHVISNIAVLTRLGLFTETVLNFLRGLRKDAPEKLAKLDESFVRRYLDRAGYFADANREQARRRLGVVAQDLYALVRAFEHDAGVRTWPIREHWWTGGEQSGNRCPTWDESRFAPGNDRCEHTNRSICRLTRAI